MNAKTETLTYAFGCEAGLRRLESCLPPLEVVYPPLVAQKAEEQGKKLPHIENPCTDDGLGILIVRSLLTQGMRLLHPWGLPINRSLAVRGEIWYHCSAAASSRRRAWTASAVFGVAITHSKEGKGRHNEE